MQNGHNLDKDGDGGRDLALEILGAHARPLLSLARRHSLCADDAQDAYQRAVEILLRRAGDLEPGTAVSWMRTVVKHEAMAVRADRQALLAREEVDLDARPAPSPSEEEQAERFDRLAAAAEALQSLKAGEVQALVLKAEGHSYREIGARMGWSYTKVNRLISEGRASFRDRYEAIASGAECERWAPVLSRLGDGEARVGELVAVRRHLRSCPGCRATLRAYVETPGRVAALVPAAAVAGLASTPSAGGLLSGLLEVLGGGLGVHERATLAAGKLGAAAEAATSSKLAAVAASTAALAGGGVVVERAVRHETPAPASAQERERAADRSAPSPSPPERLTPEAPADGASAPDPAPPSSAEGAPPVTTTQPAPPPARPRADDFALEAAAPAPPAAEARAPDPQPSRSAPPTSHAASPPAGDPGDEFGP